MLRLFKAGNVVDAASPRASIESDHDESRFEVSERCRSWRRADVVVVDIRDARDRVSNRFDASTSFFRLQELTYKDQFMELEKGSTERSNIPW